MALLASDFVSPIGDVQQGFFPADTLTNDTDGVLDVLLTKAVALHPLSEDAQEAFVYWRVYVAVVNRLNLELIEETDLNISGKRDKSQINHFKRLADKWHKRYLNSTITMVGQAGTVSVSTTVSS